MPTTIYSQMEATDQAYYDRKLLERAQPVLCHDKFGQDRPLKTRATNKIMFRRWEKLTPNTTPLVESVTPLGTSLSKTDITAQVLQYGDYVTGSDMLQWTSRDEVLNDAADVLGEQAGESKDQVCRDIVVAGSSVFCATDDVGGADTTRTNIDGLINTTFMNKVIRTLQLNNAKPFTKLIKPSTGIGTTAILPSYWAITHPEVYYTLRATTGFVSVKDYPAQQEVMEGEVGSYKDIRFVSTTFGKIFPDAGANVASGHKTTGSVKEDVYAQPVFGRNAYGNVPLTGHSLEMVSKPLGSAGTADPLNQRWTAGWKAAFTHKILNDAFMTRMETGALASILFLINWFFPSEYGYVLIGLVTGTSFTKIGEVSMGGGLLQFWTGEVDPGSIAARGEETETFALPGARPDDPVWATCEDPDVMLIPAGAKATTDLITLWMGNNYDLTTAVDAATLRVNIQILRRTNVVSF